MEINYDELKKVKINVGEYPNASLLLVTKNRPQSLIKLLIENGHFLFGENRVQEAKEKFSGCTIHFVNKKLDSGKIISKKKVKILKKDSLKKLEKRVLKEENKLYPLVLEKLIRSEKKN